MVLVTPTVALTGGLSFARTSSRGEFIDENDSLFTPGVTTVASNVGVRPGSSIHTSRSVHSAA